MKPIQIEGKFLQCTGTTVDNYYQTIPYYSGGFLIGIWLMGCVLGTLVTLFICNVNK